MAVTAWQSESWGTGGPGGGGMPPIPYVFSIPNQRQQHTAIRNNIGPARAWRAPNHPQAAVLTMCALDDLAAKLNMDPIEFFAKNLNLTKARENTYREELGIAAELMGWKQKWHPRPQTVDGMVRGVGLSFHTWGGRGHASDCDLTIHPDGSVEHQDGHAGSRNGYAHLHPHCGGGYSRDTHRRHSTPDRRHHLPAVRRIWWLHDDRRGELLHSSRRSGCARRALRQGSAFTQRSARAVGMQEWSSGRERGFHPSAELEGSLFEARRHAAYSARQKSRSQQRDLTNSGVGGVQMADVDVDSETGIVKVKKMVAVQDCGLVVDLKTAESQCYGALIMGISYSLFEEKVMDTTTGRMLNADMEFYRLAGLSDIPELVVHMMTGKGYDERGVIGLGEPPVISPGAAISNAVANAIGRRVPFLPLTPDHVLAAMAKKGGA